MLTQQIKSAVLDYVRDQPWAIDEQYLDLIHQILYHRLVEGKGFDLERAKELAALYGKDYTEAKKELPESKNVLVVPAHGTMAKRMSMFHDISGGVSAEKIMMDMKAGLDDPAIDAIVLHVDTPGGTVDGTERLSNFILGARAVKPIITHACGLMASAGVWAFTAAEKIHAESATTSVGSIGVITAHYDYSKFDEAKGVKRTFLYAGKYKAVGRDNGPLTKNDESVIQKRLDTLYTLFIDAVARNLGEKVETVRDEMADGNIFLANEAKERRLIHDIMSIEDTIEVAADMARNSHSVDFVDVAAQASLSPSATMTIKGTTAPLPAIKGTEFSIGEEGVLIEPVEAPYPNEHACRLREPNQFDSFRRQNGARSHNGKKYDVIYGMKGGKSAEQAYRYPKGSWGADEARSHCGSHGGRFDAAQSSAAQISSHDDEKAKEEAMELKELQDRVATLEGQNTELTKAVEAQKKELETVTAEKAELDKELTIIKEKAKAREEQADAEKIMGEILGVCTVDEKFHGKIKGMFADLSKFRTEDKSFDKDGYRNAVAAEVKDWEEKLGAPAGAGLGLGEGKEAVTATVPSDEVRGILSRVIPGKK